MIPRTNRGRRSLGLIPVAAAILLASGCSGGPADTDVFSANGATFGEAEFEMLLDEFVGEGVYQRTDGRVAGEDVRQLLTYGLQAELVEQFLDARRSPLTASQIAEAAETSEFAEAPEAMRTLLARLTAADAVLTGLGSPSRAELEAIYADTPLAVGSVCARHILVRTESEARDALRAIADGASFEDTARERSIDEATAVVGGALEGATGPCIDVSTLYDQQFDPDFLDAAFDASVGVPTGPVRSAFGWHVILLRPWDEVADSATANVDASPGRTLFLGMVLASDISVRPDLGRWSRADFAVVAS